MAPSDAAGCPHDAGPNRRCASLVRPFPTAPNVSPFERPLLSQELEDFSRPFSGRTVRAFSLPFVNASEALPPLRRYIDPAHAWDRQLLKRIPALTRFAGIRVIHLVN